MCGVRPECDAWGDFIVVETTTKLNEKHVKQSFLPTRLPNLIEIRYWSRNSPRILELEL